MKILVNKNNKQKKNAGMTLIEIIGVLAIIAVMVGILTPKVISSIARSKVNSAAESYNTMKTAVADYFGREGTFPVRAGTEASNAASAKGRLDADLFQAGMLDKLLTLSIGSQDTSAKTALSKRTHVRSQTLSTASKTVSITATKGGDNFDLDNDTKTADIPANSMVVSMFIPEVAVADAVLMNEIVDKEKVDGSSANLAGQCIFSTPSKGLTTVYLYLAHH